MEKLYKKILKISTEKKASDIFIEPLGSERKKYKILFKCFNCMLNFDDVDFKIGTKLINYIKIKSRVTSEGFGPKESYFSDENVAFRVTLINGFFGPVLSLRKIYREPFKNIICENTPNESRKKKLLNNLIDKVISNNRVTIISGMPSNGKTTTLFYILKILSSKKGHRIISFEEPIEYVLDEILQFNSDEFKGIDIKSIYKYLLRMAPDLLALGEIREENDWKLIKKINKSGIPVITTIHSGDISQTEKKVQENGIIDYNILFQELNNNILDFELRVKNND